MPTYPLATLAPTIDSSGISAPQYSDIYQSLIASMQLIYGADIYVAPDSQDGQLIAVFASAVNDSNQVSIALYNAFAPAYSQGAMLSSLVKLNGLTRDIASNSTAIGNVVGTVGATIIGGVVRDTTGKLWNLPATVVIPAAGTIAVTVTAQDLGSVLALVGAIAEIYNPQLGWQSFINTTVATPGSPIETDATLRIRQTRSVALPALGIIAALYSAIRNIPTVIRAWIYENDTAAADGNGIPANSIAAVVQGGTVTEIVNILANRKPPGIQTFGTVGSVVLDPFGLPTTVYYTPLVLVPIYFAITISARPGYASTTGDVLKKALVDFINLLDIGGDVYPAQAQAAASLAGLALGQTFYITAFTLGIAPAPVGTVNIVIAYQQAATGDALNINLTVA